MIAGMPRWSGVPFELDGDPRGTTASLSRVARVGRRARIVASTDTSFAIDDRWWPVWVKVLVVGLFPFGLVALPYRRRGLLTVTARPGSAGRSTVWVTGEASRLVSAATWRVLRELSPRAPSTGVVERMSVSRWAEIRQISERWARAYRWAFSVTLGTIVFVVASSTTSWSLWSDIVGNLIVSFIVVGIAARLLQLWPNNRLINVHSSRLSAAP
jgi:hypothetical protein